MKKMLLSLLVVSLLVGCSSQPETPLTGQYSSPTGTIHFRTVATADLTLMSNTDLFRNTPYSGDIFDASFERKGDGLTITTQPGHKRRYSITYHFDVVKDGAQLVLRKVDTKTDETGVNETTQMPNDRKSDLTFNKHN